MLTASAAWREDLRPAPWTATQLGRWANRLDEATNRLGVELVARQEGGTELEALWASAT
jgi:hypothetical protein